MGQWSRFWQFWRVFVPRDSIRCKNLNLLLELCLCPMLFLAINFFFHNLTCWRYEGFKNLISHTQQKKCMGHVFFRDFISSAIKFWKKFIVKTLGQIYPFNNSFKVLYQTTCIGTLQSCQNLDYCPIRNKFFIYR